MTEPTEGGGPASPSPANPPGNPPASAAEPPPVHITLLGQAGRVITAPHNTSLLRASLRHQGGIPFKCGGGICGTCKVRIESGREHLDAVKPKERKHLTEREAALIMKQLLSALVYLHNNNISHR